MENGIDPEIKEVNDFMHQWAYSFLPTSRELFLVGYCKACRNSFTSRLHRDTKYGAIIITKTDVPRFGCAAPQGLGGLDSKNG